MNRIEKIMTEPDDPSRKLKKMMQLLADINAQYSNTMFIFDETYTAHWSGEYVSKHILKAKPLGKLTSDNQFQDAELYLKIWETDYLNHSVCKALLKYFNRYLTCEERMVTAAAYLPETAGISRALLLSKKEWSQSRYYRIKKTAEIKLIDLWKLDTHDDSAF